jgi:UDP-GlcNAc:undecaprenyl-phosphate GlcNAc-1-phosphate transferase
MIYLATFLLALFVTMALIPLMRWGAAGIGALDLPGLRKMHARPMPKLGGVAMAFGVLVPALLATQSEAELGAVVVGACIVLLWGFIDDIRDIGCGAKFFGQLLAALVVVIYGGVEIRSLGSLLPDGVLLPGWVSVPLTLLAIVGVTNAINLSDGLDGLAGGIALLVFCCVGYLGFRGGSFPVALMSFSAVGAILGFLRFNTFPAALFMGDAGSQFLGFLAVTLSLKLTQGNTPLSPLLPLLLFGCPVLDTLTVMSERIARGASPFLADKGHFHHKLIDMGLFHADAVRAIYVAQAVLVSAAYVLRFHSDWLIVGVYVAFSALVVPFFVFGRRSDWKIRQYGPRIQAFKRTMREIKENGVLVRVAFRLMQAGLPSLLLLSCVLPATIPRGFAVFSALLLAAILATWFLKNGWRVVALRAGIYLMAPVLIYQGQTNAAPWMDESLVHLYNLFFGFLVAFVLVVVSFTRRGSFRSTPLDLLILFIALVVPGLLNGPENTGLVAAKMIVVFFGYEVLMSELRGSLRWVGGTTVAILALMAVRGFV